MRTLARCLLASALGIAGCHPAPVARPLPPSEPAAAPSGVPKPPPLPDAERAAEMRRDLERMTSKNEKVYRSTHARLLQRARDNERAAQTVLYVLGVRGALVEGCASANDRRDFLQQVEALEAHLKDGAPAEWAIAGPTLLLGLQAAGRFDDQLRYAPKATQAAASVWAAEPGLQGEALFDVAHALRLGCHLKEALPLLEKAVPLLGRGEKGWAGGPSDAELLARRDLATLQFLLGNGQEAQRGLKVLSDELASFEVGPDLAERREVMSVLLDHLRDGPGTGKPQPPRENGPGWQALRTVQQDASCPDATPANPQLVRVPLSPPECSVAAPSKPQP